MRLQDLSEDRLLEILLADLPVGRNAVVGPGDDCAVVQGVGDRMMLLLKTDCIAEGIHYLAEDDPVRVGWKALCRPLSDVAAMGGEPVHALISVFSPEDRPVAYWKSFYKGLSKAAKRFGVGIVGGETARSLCAAVSVAMVGRVEAARLITRSGGQPNDVLLVTGTLGGSLAGRHLDFVPRVAEGRWLSAHGYVRAMMDLSDGLAADLPRLAAASKCGFQIDPCGSAQDARLRQYARHVRRRRLRTTYGGSAPTGRPPQSWLAGDVPPCPSDEDRRTHRAGHVVHSSAARFRSLFGLPQSFR